MINLKNIVLVTFALSIHPVFSKIVKCEGVSIKRCICPASMAIRCGSKEGHIKDDARLKYLKVVVTSKDGIQSTVTLNNPPDGIRSYYSVENNDWVKQNIRGLKATDNISVSKEGYGLEDSTQLYSDPNATQSLGSLSSAEATEEEQCTYIDDRPVIVDYSEGCNNMKMCTAKIKCNLKDGVYIGSAICPATIQGGCPNATDCALDTKIQFSKPKNDQNLEVYDSQTGKAL